MKYKSVPQLPKLLKQLDSEYAKSQWRVYCKYYLERENLDKAFLSRIENLIFMEVQQKEVIQKMITTDDESALADLRKAYFRYEVKISKLIGELKLYPLATNFINPDSTRQQKKRDEEREQQEKQKAKEKLLG
ncbi:hypothetical protein [Fodinibius salsisoli]|uniref:Uncharacterized protein n=1 Tax=Fodinibius salsisoli TaxID=2820877 RepID=A0ABT3PP85_9BACT|nr:hypothetical protein [Fodinibius salsisoli]MCW9707672.1 hypothetical protein [Fodinibius salsisoli]